MKNRAPLFALSLWLLLIVLTLVIAGFTLRSVTIKKEVPGIGMILLHGALYDEKSPFDGVLSEWLVEEGDDVKKGQPLARISVQNNPKETKTLFSNHDAEIAEILAFSGTPINQHQTIVILTPLGDVKKDLRVVGFVSSLEGKKIQPGFQAKILPTIFSPHQTGFLLGRVEKVGKLPVSKDALNAIIKIPELAKYIRSEVEAEPFLVTITIDKDEAHPSGYHWVGKGGFGLDSGLISRIYISYQELSLLELIWPQIKHLIERRS